MLVVALVAVSITIALNALSGWTGREEMRSGVYAIQIFLRLAQTEAAARGRACRFLVDTSTRTLTVVDLNDPASTSDDIRIASSTLSRGVSFASPTGVPVTIELQSGATYGTTFASDGSVSAGAGEVSLQGSSSFSRITVLGAGGTRVERWDGTAWTRGS
jgi:Tfp pilus assembly protein FimT